MQDVIHFAVSHFYVVKNVGIKTASVVVEILEILKNLENIKNT